MIPTPDFRIDISITIADEVIKMGCATIGLAIATWGMIKIVSLVLAADKKTRGAA